MTDAFTDYIAPLLPLLERPDVTDVMLVEPVRHGDPGPVWVDLHGKGLTRTEVTLRADEAERLIRSVAAVKRAPLDAANPVLSVMKVFPDGSRWRFEASLPPASTAPTITIRKYTKRNTTIADYIQSKELSIHQATTIVTGLIRGEVVLISGNTGSGKTTLTNAALKAAGEDNRRIFTIEREPELERPNEVSTQRQAAEGTSFDTRAAVQSALRHRPDLIVVGELLSGSAAVECIKAWNTGHGGMTTIHAPSLTGALWRMYELVQEGSSARVEERSIARAVSVVVHVSRNRDGTRTFKVGIVDRWDGTDFVVTEVK